MNYCTRNGVDQTTESWGAWLRRGPGSSPSEDVHLKPLAAPQLPPAWFSFCTPPSLPNRQPREAFCRRPSL